MKPLPKIGQSDKRQEPEPENAYASPAMEASQKPHGTMVPLRWVLVAGIVFVVVMGLLNSYLADPGSYSSTAIAHAFSGGLGLGPIEMALVGFFVFVVGHKLVKG